MTANETVRKRRRIEPYDMVEKTNIKQHNAIIGALNDLVDDYDLIDLIPGPKGEKGEQGLPGIVEDVTVESVEGLPDALDDLQAGVDNSVKKTGNEEIAGIKTFKDGIYQKSTLDVAEAVYKTKPISRLYDVNNALISEELIAKQTNKEVSRAVLLGNKDADGNYFRVVRVDFLDENKTLRETIRTANDIWVTTKIINADGTGYSLTTMCDSPGASDVVNTKYVIDRVDELVVFVEDGLDEKQDNLTFDNVPVSGSDNPVKSKGVYTALTGKQNKLTFDDAPVSGSDNPVKSGGVYDALQSITFEIATEEDAIGGTDNSTLMTPLRVDQAFNEKFKVIDGVLNVFEGGEWVQYEPK